MSTPAELENVVTRELDDTCPTPSLASATTSATPIPRSRSSLGAVATLDPEEKALRFGPD